MPYMLYDDVALPMYIEELEDQAFATADANDKKAVALLKGHQQQGDDGQHRLLDVVKIGIDLGPLIEEVEDREHADRDKNKDADKEEDAGKVKNKDVHKGEDAGKDKNDKKKDLGEDEDKGKKKSNEKDENSKDNDKTTDKKLLVDHIDITVGTVMKEQGAAQAVSQLFTDFTEDQAERTMTAFGELFELLLTKYHDGAIATKTDTPKLVMVKMFYPQWWLNATGYYNNKPNFGPGVLMFDSAPIFGSVIGDGDNSSAGAAGFSLSAVFVWTLAMLGAGMYVGSKYFSTNNGRPSNRDYVQIGTAVEMI